MYVLCVEMEIEGRKEGFDSLFQHFHDIRVHEWVKSLFEILYFIS